MIFVVKKEVRSESSRKTGIGEVSCWGYWNAPWPGWARVAKGVNELGDVVDLDVVLYEQELWDRDAKSGAEEQVRDLVGDFLGGGRAVMPVGFEGDCE